MSHMFNVVCLPGSRFTSKPSHDFLSLIDGLLQKDVDKRQVFFFV